MRQRDKDRFVKKANKLVEDMGGVRGDRGWTMVTKFGELRLNVAENYGSGPGTVFTRFEHPKRAVKTVDCNPFSGKWNHHYFDPWSVNDALANLKLLLGRVVV